MIVFFFRGSVSVCHFMSAFICSCVEFQTALLFKWCTCVNVKWLNFGLMEQWSLQPKRINQAQLFCCVLHVRKDRNMCELYTITEKGHQCIKAAAWASPYKDNYEGRSGQNHDNKMALQVNFNPTTDTTANIMDLLHIFVINQLYLFQCVSNYF